MIKLLIELSYSYLKVVMAYYITLSLLVLKFLPLLLHLLLLEFLLKNHFSSFQKLI